MIGGSAGIGLETARCARAEGADLILTGRNPNRLQARQPRARRAWHRDVRCDDLAALEAFFAQLEAPIDHVMATAGCPYYAPVAEMDFDEARRALAEHPMLMLGVARHGAGRIRPGGTLVFMGGTGARHLSAGVGLSSAMTAALPVLAASLGTRDRSRSSQPDRRRLRRHAPVGVTAWRRARRAPRAATRDTLPIGRVVGPAAVAALAVHIMFNTALTGATYDIDGGQQLVVARTAE